MSAAADGAGKATSETAKQANSKIDKIPARRPLGFT
jgi:hypothetical protein